jgi:hypothetical protein
MLGGLRLALHRQYQAERPHVVFLQWVFLQELVS